LYGKPIITNFSRGKHKPGTTRQTNLKSTIYILFLWKKIHFLVLAINGRE
jgi:hypothetical protein